MELGYDTLQLCGHWYYKVTELTTKNTVSYFACLFCDEQYQCPAWKYHGTLDGWEPTIAEAAREMWFSIGMSLAKKKFPPCGKYNCPWCNITPNDPLSCLKILFERLGLLKQA